MQWTWRVVAEPFWACPHPDGLFLDGVLYVMGSGSPLQSYDPETGDTVKYDHLGGCSAVFALGSDGEKIYRIAKEPMTFDPTIGRWSTDSGSPFQLTSPRAVSLGSEIFVHSTDRSDGAGTELWRLDTSTGAWAKSAWMDVRRMSPVLEIIGRRIYVMGGTGYPCEP